MKQVSLCLQQDDTGRRYILCITFLFLLAYIILCLQYFVPASVSELNYSATRWQWHSQKQFPWVLISQVLKRKELNGLNSYFGFWWIVTLFAPLAQRCYKYIRPYYLHYRVFKSLRQDWGVQTQECISCPWELTALVDPTMSCMQANTWTFTNAIVTLQTTMN